MKLTHMSLEIHRGQVNQGMSSSSLTEVVKNKIKLEEFELRAIFLEQEKEAEKQLKDEVGERELADVKATDGIHLNFSEEGIPRNLLKVSSQQCLPVDQNEIPTKECLKQWPHLTSEICPGPRIQQV